MDLHLGFKTSYSGYRKFLENAKFINGKSAISLVENSKFFMNRDAECWTALEESLSFDGQTFIREMILAYYRDLEPYDDNKSREQIAAARKFENHNPEEIAFDLTNRWFFD